MSNATAVNVYDEGGSFVVTVVQLERERMLVSIPSGRQAGYPEARQSLLEEALRKVQAYVDRYPGATVTRFAPCARCSGTGRVFDATNMDRVNAGPFDGRCEPCRGAGKVGRVDLAVGPSAVELGAIPESSPDAGLPDWMLG